ncbi:MAG: DUF120 domain-containing protein [Candidatus Thermoplasmatota archaeon]|nr:DUF120 domain-containing protein [Candidatus Thermoplasmatota archaeon]
MELSGIVSSGLGRAQVFMAQEHYQSQFKGILGEEVWPGTLNVQVDGEHFAKYVALRNCSGVDTLDIQPDIKAQSEMVDVSGIKTHRIRGFLREGRSFGGATAFLATLKNKDSNEGVECAILIPDLTRHVDVIEVISVDYLREKLGLSDGDNVLLTAH